MKALIIWGLAFMGLISIACRKDQKDVEKSIEYPIEAKVLAPNEDCGFYAIKITKGLESVKSIAGPSVCDSIYIARNLPDTFRREGLNIKLDLKNDEGGVCTARGPAYKWIYVINALER